MINENSLLLFFHIPRTGGTYFCNSVGSWNNEIGKTWHYNYTENYSTWLYNYFNIPLLRNRNNLQQKEIKILSGHSIFCQAHKWFRVYKEPIYYSIVRDPLERLVSSFNYRTKLSLLRQSPRDFGTFMPTLHPFAVEEGKNYNDYDTLYEYILDCPNEINLQTKWLVKSFYTFDYKINSWRPHYEYMKNPDHNPYDDNFLTLPDWMCDTNLNIPDYIIQESLKKMWYISDFESLDSDVAKICRLFNIPKSESKDRNSSVDIFQPKWTIEEIKKQPDFVKLSKLLDLDYKLYNYVKQLKKPFEDYNDLYCE